MIKFKISYVLCAILAPSLVLANANDVKRIDANTVQVPHTIYHNNQVWDNQTQSYKN